MKDVHALICRFRAGRSAASLVLCLLMIATAAGCSGENPIAEARELERAGRIDEATAVLRDLLKQGHKEAEVYFLYGRALAASGQPSLALWPLERAMEDSKWVVRAGLPLAANALQIADYALTVDTASRVLALEPENTKALVLRALAHAHSRQNYEGALADAERALEIDPDITDAMLARGVALLGLERVEEAGEAIEKLEAHFRDAAPGMAGSERVCAVRATFAKEKRETRRAAELFEQCLAEYPGSYLVVDAAVRFYDEQGQGERALEALRKALESAPLLRAFRISLVLRLQRAGRNEEAEEILREATRVEQPELAVEAWTDLAGFHLQAENFDEGIEAFERAVEIAGQPSAELLFAYADGLIQGGRLDRALEIAERMTVRPHREFVRGRVAFERHEWRQAFAHLEEGLRLWPENAVARYLIALCAEQLGDFDRAIDEYRYSIRAGASQSDARLRLARLYLADGSAALALEVLRHDLAQQPGNLEMALLELETLARLGRVHGSIPPHIQAFVGSPENWGRGVLALARGTRAARGAAAASQLILDSDRVDLTQARNAPVLQELIVDLVELGRVGEALARVDAAIRERPEEAIFHALRGLVLSLDPEGAPEEARRSFELGLDLDPENALSLRFLAGFAAREGDAETALSLFERAVSADLPDTEALREMASFSSSIGRVEEAGKRLEELLEREPYDGAAALQLAMLRNGRHEPIDVTRALARRALRFGDSEEVKQAANRLLAELAERESAARSESSSNG